MRARPKSVRVNYAFWYAFGVTAVLAVCWLAFIPGKVSRISEGAVTDLTEPEGNFARVIRNVRENLTATVSDIAEELPKTEETATTTEVVATTTDANTLDFSSMIETEPEPYEEEYYEEYYEDGYEIQEMSSSTETSASATATVTPPFVPRVVLIGTSSKATSTQ